jgi:hypothetical protein
MARDVTAAAAAFAYTCGLAVTDAGADEDAVAAELRRDVRVAMPASSEDVLATMAPYDEPEFEPSDFSSSSDDETRERAVVGFYMHAATP